MNYTLGNIFKGDKVIWMVFFFLCMTSIVEMYSASSSLTYVSGNYALPVFKHSILLLLGVLAMLITLNINCKYFKIMTPFLLILTIILLIATLCSGHQVNGASRSLELMGVTFQASELAKGALVLTTAQILSAMQTEQGADKRGFRYILIVCALIIPLIAVENLSTGMLLAFTILVMMIIGRIPGKQIGQLVGVAAIVAAFLVVFILLVGNNEGSPNPQHQLTEQVDRESVNENQKQERRGLLHRADTWKARMLKFLDNKDVKPEDVDLDKDAQVAHANIAIVSSNVIGKGPGNSVERDFLSQAFSDFIYAIIIEETGIGGAAFVALLYIILLFRTGTIANRCENCFPAFLAMGLAILLVTQALFHMMVSVGLAPVTGQPLPLISRGGTSSVLNCIYVGVILSISRSAKKRDSPKDAVSPSSFENSLTWKEKYAQK